MPEIASGTTVVRTNGTVAVVRRVLYVRPDACAAAVLLNDEYTATEIVWDAGGIRWRVARRADATG